MIALHPYLAADGGGNYHGLSFAATNHGRGVGYEGVA